MIRSLLADLTLDSRKPRRPSPRRTRPLGFQPLESRNLMAVIPALDSLPGAPQSIFLDFDGHTQAQWNRTDSSQTYTNVKAEQFGLDGKAGFSDAEAAAIKKIWETVAEDFAPYNVNVTTVKPASLANGVGLRVVIAGRTSADLQTGPTTTESISGNVFITNGNRNAAGVLQPLDTSGYAALNSYTNSEPNVVWVFAGHLAIFPTTDNEGRTRDLRSMIATTASHEAGHAYGLVHLSGIDGSGNPSDYDVGSNTTTPIMGSNVQGDRSLWGRIKAFGFTFRDDIKTLSLTLGTRRDDFANTPESAANLPLQSTRINSIGGSVKGVIGDAADADFFRISSPGAMWQVNVSTLQFANLDAKVEIYKLPSAWWLPTKLVLTEDPLVSTFNPFNGLGASFATFLAAGDYAIGIKSHGNYGDLGQYTLNVSRPFVFSNEVHYTTLLTMDGGASATSTPDQDLIAGLAMQQVADQGTTASKASKQPKAAAADQVFAAWGVI